VDEIFSYQVRCVDGDVGIGRLHDIPLWERALDQGTRNKTFFEATAQFSMEGTVGMKRSREASDEEDGDLRGRGLTFNPFDAVRHQLMSKELKGGIGLLRHAVSSYDKEPCIIASMNILVPVFNLSGETASRVSSSLRSECQTQCKWVQLLYLSMYIGSRALRISNPADCPMSLEDENKLKEKAYELKLKSLLQKVVA